jgi:hypothetical protein
MKAGKEGGSRYRHPRWLSSTDGFGTCQNSLQPFGRNGQLFSEISFFNFKVFTREDLQLMRSVYGAPLAIQRPSWNFIAEPMVRKEGK